MNTTLLFVEIFIAGTQALVWVILLALNLTGVDWLIGIKIQEFESWMFLVSALIFSFAYSLGIIVDRVANVLFSSWDRKIGATYFPQKTRSLSVMRFQLENENLNKQLEYIRTRLRIARSSSLNYFLVILFLIKLIAKLNFLSIAEKWNFSGIAGAFGFLLVALSVASWHSLTNTNYRLVQKSTIAARKKKPPIRKKND